MSANTNRFPRILGEASRRMRTHVDRVNARREHDEAMRDRGIATDDVSRVDAQPEQRADGQQHDHRHEGRIVAARRLDDVPVGKPGCAFCS